MNNIPTPDLRPANPCFSSGPCAKRPGFTLEALSGALLGRNHRATDTKAKITEVIDRSRAILGMPADWRPRRRPGLRHWRDGDRFCGRCWATRPVDVLTFESFGTGWATDILRQLKLPNARVLPADYGALPDLAAVDPRRMISCSPGTERPPAYAFQNAGWIAANREGLAICDATSAVFAMPVAWEKLDVVTWSWQKVLGGEAAHGMLALSPRRSRVWNRMVSPHWPMPKVFRLTNKGKLTEGIFRGDTMNTPSMLCVEDALDGLRWAERIGGLPALMARSEANLKAIAGFCRRTRTVRLSGERSGDAVEHVDLPEDRFALVSGPERRRTRKSGETDRHAAGTGTHCLRHRFVPRRPAWPAHLGRRDGRDQRYRGPDALVSVGARYRFYRPNRTERTPSSLSPSLRNPSWPGVSGPPNAMTCRDGWPGHAGP